MASRESRRAASRKERDGGATESLEIIAVNPHIFRTKLDKGGTRHQKSIGQGIYTIWVKLA